MGIINRLTTWDLREEALVASEEEVVREGVSTIIVGGEATAEVEVVIPLEVKGLQERPRTLTRGRILGHPSTTSRIMIL